MVYKVFFYTLDQLAKININHTIATLFTIKLRNRKLVTSFQLLLEEVYTKKGEKVGAQGYLFVKSVGAGLERNQRCLRFVDPKGEKSKSLI